MKDELTSDSLEDALRTVYYAGVMQGLNKAKGIATVATEFAGADISSLEFFDRIDAALMGSYNTVRSFDLIGLAQDTVLELGSEIVDEVRR